MKPPSLFISHDPAMDYLSALEVGRVHDGQPPSCWRALDEQFAFYRPPRCRSARGFFVKDFSEFDLDGPEVAAIWEEPSFASPLLGLDSATAGEVMLAAGSYLDCEPTLNRIIFNTAIQLDDESALHAWRHCLETGDPMAHHGLGYTLLELGYSHEAYRHLRHYTEIAPHGSWNWCWLGKAATAIGETAEAQGAYARAIELTAMGNDKTDAPQLLAALVSLRSRRSASLRRRGRT